jgi:hypothetical protein
MEKQNVTLPELTPEQFKELERQFKEKQKAEAEKKAAERTALMQMEDEAVSEIFGEVEEVSNAIVSFKQRCIKKLEPLMRMKTEFAKAAEKQRSYSFSTRNKDLKVMIDYNETFKFDDGIHAAMELAKQWLDEQADDNEKVQMMTTIIENLLGQSRSGTYSTDKLLLFVSSTEEFDQELLNRAAEAVKKSLYKEMTSVSVRVFKKDELGQMKQLPLSATKA